MLGVWGFVLQMPSAPLCCARGSGRLTFANCPGLPAAGLWEMPAERSHHSRVWGCHPRVCIFLSLSLICPVLESWFAVRTPIHAPLGGEQSTQPCPADGERPSPKLKLAAPGESLSRQRQLAWSSPESWVFPMTPGNPRGFAWTACRLRSCPHWWA